MSARTSVIWRTEMAAVGSSISTILDFSSLVLAIATAWRWPPDIRITRVAGPRLGLEFLEELARPLAHGGVVEEAERPDALRDLPAEEDVGRRGQVVAEGEVLVDDLDALASRIGRAAEVDRLAVEQVLARRSGRGCRR